jgi:hypothetical protein
MQNAATATQLVAVYDLTHNELCIVGDIAHYRKHKNDVVYVRNLFNYKNEIVDAAQLCEWTHGGFVADGWKLLE